ncbi:hypothetical protein [Pantoea alhagi]|nr:hypothetical protein [Pantoea alhagi]
MRIQHLLLSSDGYNRIIEAEKLEDETGCSDHVVLSISGPG